MDYSENISIESDHHSVSLTTLTLTLSKLIKILLGGFQFQLKRVIEGAGVATPPGPRPVKTFFQARGQPMGYGRRLEWVLTGERVFRMMAYNYIHLHEMIYLR